MCCLIISLVAHNRAYTTQQLICMWSFFFFILMIRIEQLMTSISLCSLSIICTFQVYTRVFLFVIGLLQSNFSGVKSIAPRRCVYFGAGSSQSITRVAQCAGFIQSSSRGELSMFCPACLTLSVKPCLEDEPLLGKWRSGAHIFRDTSASATQIAFWTVNSKQW